MLAYCQDCDSLEILLVQVPVEVSSQSRVLSFDLLYILASGVHAIADEFLQVFKVQSGFSADRCSPEGFQLVVDGCPAPRMFHGPNWIPVLRWWCWRDWEGEGPIQLHITVEKLACCTR